MSEWRILEGDVIEMLRTLEDESVDAVVTDPPYEFGFMNKKWDRKAGVSFRVTTWKEVRRVMKPGAHLLAFGGPRTYHRLACAIEDAGLEIRDSIDWIFGTGFPKSLDVSKAIDHNARREYIETAINLGITLPDNSLWDWTKGEHSPSDKWWKRLKEYLEPEQWQAIEREVLERNERKAGWFTRGDGHDITAPATDAAKQWDGWGTALKPGHEPIVLARKPLEGTVAANVDKWGTGGINVDGCRVPGPPSIGGERGDGMGYMSGEREKRERRIDRSMNSGRWPPNVCLDESAAAELDRQSGDLKSGDILPHHKRNVPRLGLGGVYGDDPGREGDHFIGDAGGASRFFPIFHYEPIDFPIFRYEPKASRAERDAGLEGFEELSGGELTDRKEGSAGLRSPRAGAGRTSGGRNLHPTVKPVALMQWLCRLVTPKGGLILDPFVGSGSTGIAATREHFRFIGIDDDPGYVELARRRIEGDAPLFNRESEDYDIT